MDPQPVERRTLRRVDVGRLVRGQSDRRGRIADIPGFKSAVSLDDQNVVALDVDVLGVVAGARVLGHRVRLPPYALHLPRIGGIDDGPPHVAVPAVGMSASASIDDAKLIRLIDRKSTRLNSSHFVPSRMPSS